jgi:hypothetical protein
VSLCWVSFKPSVVTFTVMLNIIVPSVAMLSVIFAKCHAFIVMLNVVMLSVAMLSLFYAKCHVFCCNAACHYDKYCYVDFLIQTVVF